MLSQNVFQCVDSSLKINWFADGCYRVCKDSSKGNRGAKHCCAVQVLLSTAQLWCTLWNLFSFSIKNIFGWFKFNDDVQSIIWRRFAVQYDFALCQNDLRVHSSAERCGILSRQWLKEQCVGRDWIARTFIFIILILTIRVVSAYLKLRQGRKRPCCSQRIAKFRGWNRTCCASVPFWWWKKGVREEEYFYINYLASSFFLSLHTYNLVPRGRHGLLTIRVTVLTTQLWGFACMY